ncbi:MAG: tetratricopeptide repeat protein [Alphaproteobacteria bacterium]|nr:tetratricopeptide repeat protein [Alphaproteobacteria bacterium]
MTPRKEPVNALVRDGLAHLRAGRIEEGERAFRAALAQAPLHPDALHYLGLVLHRKGKFRDAADTLALAAGPLSGNADFHANFGLALKDAGRWARAKAEYGRALARDPNHANALFNLGLLLGEEGDHEGAAALFAKLAAREPSNAEARCFRGWALKGQGRTAEARAELREAVRLGPSYDLAWLRLAELELENGDLDAAMKAAEASPRDLEAAVTVAEIRDRRGETAERDAWLAKARAIEPDPARFYFSLGVDLRNKGLVEPARRALCRALLFAPDHVAARWTLARILPEGYADDAEIARARRDYVAGLDAIEAGLKLDTPAGTRSAANKRPGGDTAPRSFDLASSAAGARETFGALQVMTNFFLAYQERDDRDLQIRFGRIAHRVVAARFPEMTRPPDSSAPDPLPADPARKLRIGFLSAYFRLHFMPRFVAGWMEKIDRRRFDIFGYHTGSENDNLSKLIAGQCDIFRHLPLVRAPGRSLADNEESWLVDIGRTLFADRLDALIFTDIGMDKTTFALAALRFAPVQATCIGHPVTSGLPTIDYFLSGELIEPPGGEAHYSEKLVRLPNMSIRLFDPSLSKDRRPKPRESFGLGADDIVYLCTQSAFKYLPRYDRIYVAIAKAVPKAKLVFIRPNPPEKHAPFLARLARAFAAEGLERDQHCLFLDRLSPHDFDALHRVGDIFLDTPGWSGGNTTHQALAMDLPVVTLPGEFMRGRVSYGMLRMIGVEDTVARDVDDYIAIAIRLGREPELRARVRAKIAANRHKLYNDETCVRGLEKFLVEAVARARTGP